jgi:ribosome-associated protein
MNQDALISPNGLAIAPAALRWRFSRSGGPGGQHVNKTESRVELWLVIAEAGLPAEKAQQLADRHGLNVRVVESSSRSQHRNREIAVARLLDIVDDSTRRVVKRRPTRPSRGAVERRLEGKRKTAERKASRRTSDD